MHLKLLNLVICQLMMFLYLFVMILEYIVYMLIVHDKIKFSTKHCKQYNVG